VVAFLLLAGDARLGAAGDAANGAQIYTAQKCNVCHKIDGKGGKLGPELTAVGNKRDTAWLTKYLVNPKSDLPTNKMPPVKMKGKDLEDVIAYLLTLKADK
jgi:cytochrome c2